MDEDINLGELKQFSNPMYEAHGSDMYEVPSELVEKGGAKEGVPFEKPTMTSAILSPSSVTHKSSVNQKRALDPTSIETDKDTQNLVEEDSIDT